jgi:hypothetical protein
MRLYLVGVLPLPTCLKKMKPKQGKGSVRKLPLVAGRPEPEGDGRSSPGRGLN